MNNWGVEIVQVLQSEGNIKDLNNSVNNSQNLFEDSLEVGDLLGGSASNTGQYFHFPSTEKQGITEEVLRTNGMLHKMAIHEDD